MGIANAERTLDNLRVFTQFISQRQYRDVVVAIGLVNEPLASQIGLYIALIFGRTTSFAVSLATEKAMDPYVSTICG
jgi:aryl-phospho-beta-D-glucosidase BglC (GH1 family)